MKLRFCEISYFYNNSEMSMNNHIRRRDRILIARAGRRMDVDRHLSLTGTKKTKEAVLPKSPPSASVEDI